MGSIKEALEQAGYKKEVSTSGDVPVLEGVYRATLVEVGENKESQFGGSQMYVAFKVTEVLAGRDSFSKYPEFKGYFRTDAEQAANKRSGIAKVLNGLFSVGIDADPDDLTAQKGAEVFIKGFKQKKMEKKEDGSFAELEGQYKQGWSFLTESNAKKEVEKLSKTDAPF